MRIFIIDKKIWISILITICIVTLFFITNVIFDKKSIFTMSDGIKKKTIVLDAGHGGEDGGAKSKNGIIEKDLNLQICMKLKNVLEEQGFSVILTRDSDIMLSDSVNIKTRKTQDIYKRIDIINSSNADMIISIHMNSFPEEKYFGFQTFYKKNCLDSAEIAKNIQECLLVETQIENKRVSMEIQGVRIIENSTIPAILVECGFLSNENETQMLCKEEYQKKLVNGILNGINKWYE